MVCPVPSVPEQQTVPFLRSPFCAPSRCEDFCALFARNSEEVTVQFRAEFFNLFNRPNLYLPDLYLGSPTFGRILSEGELRHIQLGLKLLF